MKQLIMKDMRLLGFSNFMILGASILFGYIGVSVREAFKSNLIYGFTMIIAVYIITINTTTKEYKAKSDSLMVSMPVKKSDIINSRYIFMIIYIIGISALIYTSSNISKILFNDVPGKPLALMQIAIISSIAIIFLAFNLPFQYYNVGKAQTFNAVLYMLIILLPSILRRYEIDLANNSIVKWILGMNFSRVSIILLGVSLVLYFISSFVSKGIYQSKEF